MLQAHLESWHIVYCSKVIAVELLLEHKEVMYDAHASIDGTYHCLQVDKARIQHHRQSVGTLERDIPGT